MKRNSFLYYCLVILLLLLPILLLWPRGSRISYNEEYRDTVIFNVTYKDTTIYNISKKDSTIYDYTLVPLKDTIRINDTLYMSLPLYRYRFKDEFAVIYCSGYNVLIDSVSYHFPAVEKMIIEKTITPKPKRLSGDIGFVLGKVAQCYYINIDVATQLSFNDFWSLTASAGLHSDGSKILPYGELGIRRKLR